MSKIEKGCVERSGDDVGETKEKIRFTIPGMNGPVRIFAHSFEEAVQLFKQKEF